MAVDLARFHATFIGESFAGLDSMEADLLRLEAGEQDPELLQSIFRVVHSIKGAGASLGFEEVADFSHGLESLLDDLRSDRARLTPEIADTLLQAVDVLRGLLGQFEGAELIAKERVLEVQQSIKRFQSSSSPSEVRLPDPVSANLDLSRFHIKFRPLPDFFRSGDDPLRILRELTSLGSCKVFLDASRLPELPELDAETSYLAWSIELETTSSLSVIEEAFAWAAEDSELEILRLSDTSELGVESANRRESDNRPRRGTNGASVDGNALQRSATLQVSTEKVDQLVNLVGELVITQTMLKQCGDNFSITRLDQLQSAIGQLERNSRDLQQAVLAIRMLPVSFLFSRFHRLVRDVAISLGKRVELEISGESNELDKTVIEKLVDPLTHLVRNSLDHGIEMPEQRIAAGKKPLAKISLHAQHKAGTVEIEVRDDGRGIDLEKVKAKSISMGLIKVDSEPTDEELLNQIFASGFSTAAQVTDLSGRGVGLDVVRRNILSLGGSIEVTSELGKGTTIRVRLPLTLAIVEGMFVRVKDETFVLPLAFIVECVQPQSSLIRALGAEGQLVEIRGEYLPILELGRMFGVEGAAPLSEGVLVLLEAENRRFALLVDNVVGQDQVVIKSLEANYGRVAHLSGATILGDGRVALILDANSLARTLGAKERSGSRAAQFVVA